MSAIFGVYNLNGKPVPPHSLAEMSDILSHRGTDSAGVWSNEAVGLGHRMLWTTPESLQEQVPKSIDGGDLTITADARIDNREELLNQLDYKFSKNVSDSEIILAAYEKWGKDCPAKLLGDFVFAIWDRRQKHLFCARDHFGVKPFYYYKSENCFAFASEIKALFSLAEVPRSMNEDSIADYLIGNYDDKAATFYQQILRLPPAHSLSVASESMCLQSYYSLDPNRELRLASNEDYAEGLREIFTEAVRCRMRSALPVGSKLSGGLDSSSIACVARNLLAARGSDLLPTFSLVYDRIKECDERQYINHVLAQGGFQPHFMAGDKHTPLNNLEAIARHTDRPAMGPGHSTLWELYKTIGEAGVRVIFDGHDGDSAVSYGYKYLDELAQAGRWLTLAVEARELAPIFSMSARKIVAAYVKQYRWRPFLRKHSGFKRIDNIGQRLSRRKPPQSFEKADFALRSVLINEDFAQRVNLTERYSASRRMSSDVSRTARQSQYLLVTSGGQSLALEELDAVAAAFGIETRYPFWDKRLIEYCLSLPGEQKCNRGWNRVVMRRAMANVLPSEVCWRREKTDFTANMTDGLINTEKKWLKHLLTDDIEIIHKFFDKRALHETYQKINSRGFNSGDTEGRRIMRMVWNVASLFSWLKQMPDLS